MSKWREIELGKVIRFNPPERIAKGSIAKKIAMEKLIEYQRKIVGYELAQYNGGPKFRNGDTLVARITPCLENGKTAQVDILNDNEVAFGSTEFIVLRETEETINDYIYYLAKSPAFRKKAISCMEGTSGRKRVNENALKLQKLPIPDIKTQQNIAKILSVFDSKISLNNRINAELEAMAKTIYDYWFVQFDFPISAAQAASMGKPNLKGKPYKASGGKMVWSEELKREIPEGWGVKGLGEIINIYDSKRIPLSRSQREKKVGHIPYYGATGIMGYVDEFIFNDDYVLLAEDGSVMDENGFPIVQFIWGKTWVNNHAHVMQAKNKINNEYIFYLVKTISVIQIMSGSIQLKINQENLRNVKVSVPNDDTLEGFASLAIPIRKKLINNIEENQKLTELRDWLLPMLMNGQVKIRDAERELAMAAEPSISYAKKKV